MLFVPSQPGENQELSQTLPWFSPGYEGTENMFYFFYKIIIFRQRERRYTKRVCVV